MSTENSELFPAEDLSIDKVGTPAFTGVSTGERLLSQRPDLYRITVQLLGQGTGIREIKRLTGLHHRTIEAVQLREGATIDTHRKDLGARALKVAALGVELLEEKIAAGDIKAGELSMAVGILIDKGQVLTGGVTARVEKIEQSQVAAGLERMLDDLPVIDVELVQDGSGINSAAGNLDSIARPSLPDPAADLSSSDHLSVIFPASERDDVHPATTLDTNHPSGFDQDTAADTSKEGGRGVDPAALAKTATDQSSGNFIANASSQEGLSHHPEKKEGDAKNKKKTA